MEEIYINKGFDEKHRAKVAALFWQAFEPKLSFCMKPKSKALEFIENAIRPDHALSAVDANGNLLGIVGFKTSEGAFLGGELSGLTKVYGKFGGLWRGIILSTLERSLAKNQFLMDGIFVTKQARGQGVGTKLLEAIFVEAKQSGASHIRLDVIDTNPKAKALYERVGFKEVGVETTGPLYLIFGFKKSTTMLKTIDY